MLMGMMLVQFQLFTALVFDEYYNGIPAAFALCSRATAEDIASWMEAIAARCRVAQGNWAPSSFIVDDCDAEIKAIRYAIDRPVVAQCKILHVPNLSGGGHCHVI